jgi:hypothetical protein
MDEADEEEPEEKKLTADELQQKIDEMRRQRAEAEKMSKKLDESGQSQISLSRCASMRSISLSRITKSPTPSPIEIS